VSRLVTKSRSADMATTHHYDLVFIHFGNMVICDPRWVSGVLYTPLYVMTSLFFRCHDAAGC